MPQDQEPLQAQDHEDVIPLGKRTDPSLPLPPDQVESGAPPLETGAAIDPLQDATAGLPETGGVTEPHLGISELSSGNVADVEIEAVDKPAAGDVDLDEPKGKVAGGRFTTDTTGDGITVESPQSEDATIPLASVPDDVPDSEGASEAAAGRKSPKTGGWRLRVGGKADERSGTTMGGTSPAGDPDVSSAASTTLRALREFFDPGFRGIELRWMRRTMGGTLTLILALLLANQAGLALIVASAVVPTLVVLLLAAHDLYERESPLLLFGVGIAGGVAGILIGSIAAWIVRSQWFDRGHLNFGAGGFGGHFALDSASLLVWFVVGLILPAATVAGLAAAPLLMRRWPQFTNEVMDGMILAGTSAAGVATGLATTFWWPMTNGDGPLMDVGEWTLMIAGQVLLRPLVISLSGALIGAGVWRYMLHLRGSVALVLPAAGGVFGVMALSLGSVALQPSGIWPEFLLTLVLAIIVFAAYRRTLESAIATDAAAMGADGERMICPHCHLITPTGDYCGRCGKPLAGALLVDMD